MNGLIRQMAVLSVLWSLCELLLPEGRAHKAARMTASVLVMTALLAGAGRLMRTPFPELTVLAPRMQQAAAQTYQETALRVAANQVRDDCQRLAERAGYQGRFTAYLTLEGRIDHIEGCLTALETPIQTAEALRQLLEQRYEAPVTLTGGSCP